MLCCTVTHLIHLRPQELQWEGSRDIDSQTSRDIYTHLQPRCPKFISVCVEAVVLSAQHSQVSQQYK